MIIDPYDTFISTHMNVNNLKHELLTYYIRNDERLNYEYQEIKGILPVIITGKNSEEKDLTIWRHPIFIESPRDEKILVFLDARSFVNATDRFETVHHITKNKSEADFQFTRMVINCLLHKDNMELLNIIDNSVLGFSTWLTGMLGQSLFLDQGESLSVNIATLHYLTSQFNNRDLEVVSNNTKQANIFKTSRYLRLESRESLQLATYVLRDANMDPKDTDDLVENIKACVDSPKVEKLTKTALWNSLTSSWYGQESKEKLMLSLEHPATWLAIMYVAIKDRSYKRSRITSMLMNNKKKLDLDNFAKYIENKVNEHKI